jgi:hypothetical protein
MTDTISVEKGRLEDGPFRVQRINVFSDDSDALSRYTRHRLRSSVQRSHIVSRTEGSFEEERIATMNTVTCPTCGTGNRGAAMNCETCTINLAFALEHPAEIEGQRWGVPRRLSSKP